MKFLVKSLLISALLFVGTLCYGQIDVARLMTKTLLLNKEGTLLTRQNISATGFGSFLNFGFDVVNHDAITVEGGFYYFKYQDFSIYSAPCLISYRHLINGDSEDGHGWYVEPAAGYAFGETDIQESDPGGHPFYTANGDPINQKTAGPAGAVSFGYLFAPSGWIRFNIGLRYEHTFVNGDPGINVLALRISHAFSFGRKD